MSSETDKKSQQEPAWVWLGKIRRPQGRKGEVLATVLTDFPEKFSERKRLWLLTDAGAEKELAREIELRHHWLHKGDLVLHFAGVDSISDAEKLAGMTVAIPWGERAALEDDAYYAGDLMGCELVDVACEPGRVIGVIEDVDREAGPVALLVVRSVKSGGPLGGDELLIPWAKAYLRRVDLGAKRVEMALPDGLVEVNSQIS